MKTSILSKLVAWSGAGLGSMSWASDAEAGLVDEGVVDIYPGPIWSYMSGTTYGTRRATGVSMQCEHVSDWGLAGQAYGICTGMDAQGERFYCGTGDPTLLRAIQTMPDFGRIFVYASASSCRDIYSYRGSRYLPPGTPRASSRQIDVGGYGASGSFYGARVSNDTSQYAECSVQDASTYSFAYCQAKDAAGDYFYCDTAKAGMVEAARATKNYSSVRFLRDPSYQCLEISTTNGSADLP